MKKQQILVGMVVTPTPKSTGLGYVVNIEDAAFISLFIQKMLKPFLPDIKIEVESLEINLPCKPWDEDMILRNLCEGWADVVYDVKLAQDIMARVKTQEEARILVSKSWTDERTYSDIRTRVIPK